ncbi:hypothetical protein AA15237_1098 [Komagataeibacter xylinus NBRC 15237]|uniref:hypothetical protein n=1 Tax=Komagataeibacter xylinus TaxID=28448 RepID=UPI0011B4E187|nr:hypothetical protein [Komagataeibacter xylinus]GBQ71448.1 hypothetical protein AA15237_1098 [Komagataeibacter xylinus NBRC 15237]
MPQGPVPSAGGGSVWIPSRGLAERSWEPDQQDCACQAWGISPRFHQWIIAAACLSVVSGAYAYTPSEQQAVPEIRAAMANPDTKNLFSIATHEKCNVRIEYKNGPERSDTCNVSLYNVNRRLFISAEIFGNNNTQVIFFGFFSDAASNGTTIGQNINGIQVITNGQSYAENATGTCRFAGETKELICNAQGTDKIRTVGFYETGVMHTLK